MTEGIAPEALERGRLELRAEYEADRRRARNAKKRAARERRGKAQKRRTPRQRLRATFRRWEREDAAGARP